ncbi:G-protein beta WD-40 repeat-containing protein [Cynara cardunculus var. scolymus]|uniref:G-protein beta WD-40 repeat-containing protein n=1 Tax=Cynara cardunculus var. scolymus TaxID=59895 RepID=A0A118K6P1_CYNCS|nr:G-protein beta WD-40 repeat-containing protein [Cynara cardunculus var. scolymus]
MFLELLAEHVVVNESLQAQTLVVSSTDLCLQKLSGTGMMLTVFFQKLKANASKVGSTSLSIELGTVNEFPRKPTRGVGNPHLTVLVNEDVVQDVAWHSRHESLFGSCGDDRNLHIWDIRSPCLSVPVQSFLAHESEMNCLAFNPFNDWIVATGSIDKTVKLFDLRKFTTTLYTLESHKRGVNQIGWSPHHPEVLASGCDGGPPELLFIHGGHTDSVVDLSWNPCEDWTIASVANDNMLQIWKLAEHIYQFVVETNEPPEHAKGG